jgi:hypothetical protein
MKRFLFILLIGLSINLIFAQDTIVKQNGDRIPSKILEIISDSIQYAEFEFQDGPIRNIDISEVSMIIYGNGKREQFPPTDNQDSEDALMKEDSQKTFKGRYLMLGAGMGNSYGGYGIRLQWRYGGNLGYGFHAGVGYDPGAPISGSAGVKFFYFKGLYIDFQFATKWMKQIDSYIIGYEQMGYPFYLWIPITEDVDNSYMGYGPALMVGGDWVWGKKIAYGLNVGLGVLYLINGKTSHSASVLGTSEDDQHFQGALDLGFIIRF